ncbi:MAG: Holliday junction branch migration protein RuvA [candidate division KSB1 bacterium]|nr:Holliday junction branch migration protein RuvA [candidate division KSB1 bacterium]
MIARLRGRVVEKGFQSVLLDVQGIGFEVAVPLSTAERLIVGSEAELLTYLHVREDTLQLYGFLTRPERELFEHLLSVSGVGPKLALNLLSARGVEVLRKAIAGADLATLTAISGVGRKTAERIVVELREKLGGAARRVGDVYTTLPGAAEEAVLALVSLGFARKEAERALQRVLGEHDGKDLDVDQLIREALRQL